VIAEARSAPIEAQRRAMLAMQPPSMPAAATPQPPLPVHAPLHGHDPAAASYPHHAPMSTAAPPQPAAPAAAPAQNWAAEISARQRALDGGGAAARAPRWQPAAAAMPAQPPVPSQDLSALEHQLRTITTQIASLHQPYESALTALRSDLAEVGRALKDAMPRHAVEALESEVRALSDRIGRSRQAGGDPAALANLEQGLTDIREALRNLAPAENLIGFEDAVRGLSHKIDQLAANSSGAAVPEPAVFHQLEEAIAAMRHVGSHVASDGALAQLAAEVHGLAARFERATQENSSNEVLHRLESRISSLMESGRSVPPDLDEAMRSLTERLDRMQLSQGDQLALQSLEDRIVKLVERLDTCDARLGNLDVIERGMADVLVHLQEMKKANVRARAVPALPEPPAAELDSAPLVTPPPAQALAAMPVAPQLRPPSPEVIAPPPAAEPPPAPKPLPPPQAPRAERRPIDPDLPADTPLEPGSGAPRSRPGSPAARIAASEAAFGGGRSAMSEKGAKSAAIAAARNAAMAQSDAPEDKPRKSLFAFLTSRKPKAPKQPKPPKEPKVAKIIDPDAPQPTLRQQVIKHLKTLLIATSVVIIVLGTLQTAMDLFMAPPQTSIPGEPAGDGDASAPDASAPSTPRPQTDTTPPAATAPATVPSRPMPTPDAVMPAPAPSPDTTNSIGRSSALFDPTTVLAARQQPPAAAEGTGSIPPRSPAADGQTDALPASIGPQLRSAAAQGDRSAEYEIAGRFAEGRGVARNMDEAVRWLDRGAKAGFAPAQFRLAGIYEKGEGVRKDLQAARRLYQAAAERGHAKAMHNLAVLHAEGIDGKPDYPTAARWFRQAAAYGVADSQFNLAILYARGIGTEQNLAESFKWFALAANTGDQDAGRKRDEVATRLDPQTLMAARLAVQTFTAQREPEEAIAVKSPPGGWDRTTAAAQPKKPKSRPRPSTP
jgi:localization factor PodJL